MEIMRLFSIKRNKIIDCKGVFCNQGSGGGTVFIIFFGGGLISIIFSPGNIEPKIFSVDPPYFLPGFFNTYLHRIFHLS
jgi:hypothetical protein